MYKIALYLSAASKSEINKVEKIYNQIKKFFDQNEKKLLKAGDEELHKHLKYFVHWLVRIPNLKNEKDERYFRLLSDLIRYYNDENTIYNIRFLRGVNRTDLQKKALELLKAFDDAFSKLKMKEDVKIHKDLNITFKDIKSDFENFRPGSYYEKQFNVNRVRNTIEISFRDLGRWVLPDDVPYGEEEDYDWEVWDRGEYKKYLKIFKDWLKNQSWKRFAKNPTLTTGEKNWAYFSVELPKKLFK